VARPACILVSPAPRHSGRVLGPVPTHMTIADENELNRLAAMLETIDRSLERGSPHREALKKAGIALSLGFIRGLRSDIERQFQQLGTPLTDAERTRLSSMGLDPEST
jgi:hypothetical protein